MKQVEYRVRPVVRYVVTHWYDFGNTGGCGPVGEFDNEQAAERVAAALSATDPDSERPNGFLLIQDTHEVETKAFFAHSLTEARELRTKLEDSHGGTWLLVERR
jgi:uncharacterized protein YtpQ (UPF0354 family)